MEPGPTRPSEKDSIGDLSSSPLLSMSMASYSLSGSSISSLEDKHVVGFSTIGGLSVRSIASGVHSTADSASLVCSITATSLRPTSRLVASSALSSLASSFPAFEPGPLGFHILGISGYPGFLCRLVRNPYMRTSLRTRWGSLMDRKWLG
jgi:hypothetical protein